MAKGLVVVEDEPRVCGALKLFFEKKGLDVGAVSNEREAVKLIKDGSKEVVVLDLKLPDDTGMNVLTRIKGQFPDLNVVVMSGLADQETIREAQKKGASSFLTKPVDFTRCFYAAMGIETIDITTVQVEQRALIRLTRAMAEEFGVLPIRILQKTLEVASSDPLNVKQLELLRSRLKCDVRILAATGEHIVQGIERWYGRKTAGSKKQTTRKGVSKPTTGKRSEVSDPEINMEDSSVNVSALLQEVIQHARRNRATDLHLSLDQQGPIVRERIDGVLYDVPVSDTLRNGYQALIAYIKTRSNIPSNSDAFPREGRMWFGSGNVRFDLHVSLLPALHGESIAIRLFESSRVFELAELGMSAEQRSELEVVLAKPTGLLLVTGPAGSGKSTSLYALLARLNTGGRHIVTIEELIERELIGTTQIQANPESGLTVASGLRSILRHDPDIILVNELKDRETASLAVGAALTGHLVLSSLSTQDASGAITRLFDLGIEPFLLCSTLSGIVSQRLVRQLCVSCRESQDVGAAALKNMGISMPGKSDSISLWNAKGCQRCRNTGYHGRTGIFETLMIDSHVRSLIIKRSSGLQVRQSAIARGMKNLWQSGWQKVQSGETSLQELVGVVPPDLR